MKYRPSSSDNELFNSPIIGRAALRFYMLKKIIVFILCIILLLSMVSCKNKHANVLFEELDFSTETINDWSAEINYISETRGTTDFKYSIIRYDSDNPAELMSFINIFFGAATSKAPDNYYFSAEGMSDYKINFYKKDIPEPVLSFYYWKAGDLLTRAIHRFDEKRNVEIIDYEFYVPYGDLSSAADSYHKLAIEPNNKKSGLSLNPKQLIASVEEDELKIPENENTQIEFEIYTDDMPFDEGTASKMYDKEDIPSLEDGRVVIMARIAGNTGDPLDLVITFVEYNEFYTIVYVSYPNEELQAELGLETPNTIILNESDIDPDKYIVFLDDEGKVVYVVVPFME